MDSFQFLESEREVELDVGCGVGVMRQLLMVVEAVVLGAHSEADMPFHAVFLPLGKPIHLCAGTAEEFHLHLLELPHPEYELTGDNLVAESLSDLGDSERNLHATGLLDVEVLHEYSLGGLGTEVDLVVGSAGVADLGGEHQVELPYVGPVGRAGDGADDAAVNYDVPVGLEVVGFLGSEITRVDLVVFILLAKDVGIRGPELLLVEGIPETLAALGDFLLDLLLDLSEVVLDEVVGAVALL